MKKNLYFALLLCLYATPILHAEEKHVAMKVTPFGNLLLDIALTHNFVLSGDLTANNMSMGGWNSDIATAYSAGIRGSWHKRGAFEQGSYVAVYMDYIFFEYNSWGSSGSWGQAVGEQGSGETQAIGFISGYQWLWDDALSVNLGGGYGFVLPTSMHSTQISRTYDRLGKITSQTEVTSNTDIPGSSNFILDFYIGYAF